MERSVVVLIGGLIAAWAVACGDSASDGIADAPSDAAADGLAQTETGRG